MIVSNPVTGFPSIRAIRSPTRAPAADAALLSGSSAMTIDPEITSATTPRVPGWEMTGSLPDSEEPDPEPPPEAEPDPDFDAEAGAIPLAATWPEERTIEPPDAGWGALD